MITFCLYVGTIIALAVPLIVPVGLVFAGVTTLGLVSGPHASALLRFISSVVFIDETAAACLLYHYDPMGVMIWFFG